MLSIQTQQVNMDNNRYTPERIIETAKKMGVIGPDGKKTRAPTQMVMDEIRENRNEKLIEGFVAKFDEMEKWMDRVSLVSGLKSGFTFLVVVENGIDNTIKAAKATIGTPLEEGGVVLIPGLYTAMNLVCCQAEAAKRKLIQLGEFDEDKHWGNPPK